jgi:dTDP-4-amino-4,6-dideoxygalactose transaminase
MTYAPWGAVELTAAARASLATPSEAAARLKARIEGEYGGRATLFNSGRAALEAGLRQAARGGRKKVLAPALICRSVPERVAAAGLEPVFYDVRPDFTPDLEEAVSRLDRETACLVVAPVYGALADARPAAAACRELGVGLMEDCAAAFLRRDETGRLAGLDGDWTVFSFSTGKTLVAGGGGVLIQRVDGETPAPSGWTEAEERRMARAKFGFALKYAWPSWGYALERITGMELAWGTSEESRAMAAVDAALVEAQWAGWERRRAERAAIIGRYAAALAGCEGIDLPQARAGGYVNRLFVVLRNGGRARRDEAARALRARGVQVHLPYEAWGGCPVAARLSESALAVPSQPGLSEARIEIVCEALRAIS